MSNLSRRSRKRSKAEICRLVTPADSNPADLAPTITNLAPLDHLQQPLNLCVRDEVTTAVPIVREQSTNRPRRKKRSSAIFSIPNEKLAKNDVSICKFKFVSGMQPRLQDKKILSLDSAGAFRFFPETSKSSATASGSSPTVPKPVPDLLPIETVRPTWSHTVSTTASSPTPSTATNSTASTTAGSSRKLSRRQKMEQTFGEKGFLIQTQHVPATEGAAFCKFRQLKKFTRYLYRSWRHYLPEDDTAALQPSTTKEQG